MAWRQFINRTAFRKRLAAALAVVMAIACMVLMGLAYRAHQGLSRAHTLAELGLWSQARTELNRYVTLHPGADQARLLLAEAFVKDEALASNEAVPQAIAVLRQVRDNSPLAAQARLQEGRLELLLLHRPGRAEACFREAMAQPDGPLEASLLLWKTLDLTGRYYHVEPIFWRIFEQSPDERKHELLAEWYMSQFYPATGNADVQRSMGLLGAEDEASDDTELQCYVRFIEAEPDSPLGHAAAAHWYQFKGDPQKGLDVLDRGAAAIGHEPNDPFWLAARIRCLIELGEFEAADAQFQRWPKPHEGFEYWRARALVFDEVRGDFPGALAAYDQALTVWPGPMDWRLRNRRATCLTRSGNQSEAVAERTRAVAVEELSREEVHRRLRELLVTPQAEETRKEMAELYRKIGRPREAELWLAPVKRASG